MTPQQALRCFKCGHEPAVGEFLMGLCSWWPQLRIAHHVCPECSFKQELQLGHAAIKFGYAYAAGSPHFAAIQQVQIPGIEIAESTTQLEVKFDDHLFLVKTIAKDLSQ